MLLHRLLPVHKIASQSEFACVYKGDAEEKVHQISEKFEDAYFKQVSKDVVMQLWGERQDDLQKLDKDVELAMRG